MTEKRLRLIDAELAEFQDKKRYSFKELLRYFQIQIQKQDSLKLLKTREIQYYAYEDELRPVPSYASIASHKKMYEKMYNIYLHLSTAVNQRSFKIPLYLCTNYFYELERPYNTVKINEKKSPSRSFYTWIEKEGDVIKFHVDAFKLSDKDLAYAQKRKVKVSSHESLGHTSFHGNRLQRLVAEAKDPPGYLLVTKNALPPILGDFKYKSSQFYLYSPTGKAEEKCQIVIFDSIAQREVFAEQSFANTACFPCNFTLPDKS